MSIVFDSVFKNYGRREVLEGISFECTPGSVTGLLGPNGAGKSTLIRCLLGLTRQSAGTALIDGVGIADMAQPQRTIGAILDPAAHHPGRSVRSTLLICAGYLGVSPSVADQLLQEVGLEAAAAKPLRAISLGMKQRLSIAIALIGSPRYLVLDEPMNGLDIEGVRWFRQIVRGFASHGGTVLVSSHMLPELQAYADHVVTIKDGRVVDDRAMSQVSRSPETIVRPSDMIRLRELLDQLRIDYQSDANPERLRVATPSESLARIAFDHEVLLLEVRPVDEASLEDHYLEVTSEGGDRDGDVVS